MKIPVVRLEPGNQWDQNMIELLLANKIFDTGYEFEFVDVYPDAKGIVLIIPGQYWKGREKEMDSAIADYEWVVAIKTGDEEDLFDTTKFQHPNIKWWIQTPRTDRTYDDARLFGVGFPPHFNDLPKVDKNYRNRDVFLSGQNTHNRRSQAFSHLYNYDGSKFINETDGFTKGMEKEDYVQFMVNAKVAPAPSGVFSPDSFRLYEALEAQTVPIADDISPNYKSVGYWRMLFPDAPFPILVNYNDLSGYINDVLSEYPSSSNKIAAWWIEKKRDMAKWLTDDINQLSGIEPVYKSDITVIIPVSPIKSHPDTYILDETIKSVRHHLPNAEIIVTFDGVRKENEDRRADYDEFISRMLWKLGHEYKNVLPVIFDEHMHQTGMARNILDKIKTPLLLYVEQDTPLVTDESIDWEICTDFIIEGHTDVIRFHHEGVIPKEHEHMMLESGSVDYMGVIMQATCQWSQRPHLATVAFYRRILDTCFTPDAKSFIEDKMHGICYEAYKRDGYFGWEQYRICIYAPAGNNIKRSYHTDGRAGEAKYDDTQVF
jgi:hypothetical protein